MTTQENNNGNEAINSQYYQQPHLIFVDNINDMLRISDINEMDSKIAKNTINITKIFQYFQNNVYDGSSITKEDINKLIHCLKFVDTLNLFMTNQATSTLLRYMEEIYDLFNVLSNTESKDLILKQIKYTEMTVLYYKKKTFKQLYFGDSKLLAKEIEYNLELVNKNGKFDQKLFKQMQTLFYVVQGKIEETKRNEIQTKMNELKTISIKIKKRRFNSPNQGNYYDDYNDYSDYKNYSNISGKTYDYNDNFYDNDNYYEDNDYYYQDKQGSTIPVLQGVSANNEQPYSLDEYHYIDNDGLIRFNTIKYIEMVLWCMNVLVSPWLWLLVFIFLGYKGIRFLKK